MVIDTLMAIWNRGYGGRSAMVFSSFVLICISISLLLATTRVSWLALHGDAPGNQLVGNGASNQTARTNDSTPTVDATAEHGTASGAAVNSCLLTPLESETPGVRGTLVAHSTSQKSTGRSSSTTPGTSGSGGAHPTPAPKQPGTPTPLPKPTPPMTPSPGGTPTPAPTLTPISTATPVETPTPAPTLTPTPTQPPETPTAPPTSTRGATPTVPWGNGIPTPTVSGANANGQHPLAPGSSSSTGSAGVPGSIQPPGGNGADWNPDCFSASLANGGESSALLYLERGFWLILVGAGLCTLLFCAGRWLCSRRHS